MKKECLLLFCMVLNLLAFGQEPNIPGSDWTPTTAINGLLYKLNDVTLTAMVANGNSWEGELNIPERVIFDGKTYTVDRMEWLAFENCRTLTKVKIPKTVEIIKHYAEYEDCKNPFDGCTALECIEVDKENQSMCSVGGVLFSKDKMRLYCYPAGASSKEYTVPDGVKWIGGDAFACNPYIVAVSMPNSVTHLSFGIFSGCKSLQSVSLPESINYVAAGTFENCESLIFLDIPENVSSFAESVFRWSHIKTLVIRGNFPEGFRYDTFYNMDDEVVIYVQQSEVEKLKSELKKLKDFSGSVLPLNLYNATSLPQPSIIPTDHSASYNLQGHRFSGQPQRGGGYIQNGRKVLK